MSKPQSAIVAASGPHALFLVMNLGPDEDGIKRVLQQGAALGALAKDLHDDESAAVVKASLAFGRSFWDRLSPDLCPSELKPFPALDGRYQAPATGGDLFLHLHGDRADLVYELARRFLDPLRSHVEVREEVHGFRYLDARDLTGFIDGTENPEGEARSEVALIGDEDPEFSAGSYVLTQRYVHHLQHWDRLAQGEQEKIIGRSKPDSIELDESLRPDTAHISRVVIEEEGEELEILRHSMPYGQVSGDAGLFFVAYNWNLSTFDSMLARMYGTSDRLSDALLEYTHPVSGAYFFAPSLEKLQELAG